MTRSWTSKCWFTACWTLNPRGLLFSGTTWHFDPAPRQFPISGLPVCLWDGCIFFDFVLRVFSALAKPSSQNTFQLVHLCNERDKGFLCGSALRLWDKVTNVTDGLTDKYRWSQEGYLKYGNAGKVWAWTLLVTTDTFKRGHTSNVSSAVAREVWDTHIRERNLVDVTS